MNLFDDSDSDTEPRPESPASVEPVVAPGALPYEELEPRLVDALGFSKPPTDAGLVKRVKSDLHKALEVCKALDPVTFGSVRFVDGMPRTSELGISWREQHQQWYVQVRVGGHIRPKLFHFEELATAIALARTLEAQKIAVENAANRAKNEATLRALVPDEATRSAMRRVWPKTIVDPTTKEERTVEMEEFDLGAVEGAAEFTLVLRPSKLPRVPKKGATVECKPFALRKDGRVTEWYATKQEAVKRVKGLLRGDGNVDLERGVALAIRDLGPALAARMRKNLDVWVLNDSVLGDLVIVFYDKRGRKRHLQVQLKTTRGARKRKDNYIEYEFTAVDKYPGMLVLCVVAEEGEERFGWVFDGNALVKRGIEDIVVTPGAGNAKLSLNPNSEAMPLLDLLALIVERAEDVTTDGRPKFPLVSEPFARWNFGAEAHEHFLEMVSIEVARILFEGMKFPDEQAGKFDMLWREFWLQLKCVCVLGDHAGFLADADSTGRPYCFVAKALFVYVFLDFANRKAGIWKIPFEVMRDHNLVACDRDGLAIDGGDVLQCFYVHAPLDAKLGKPPGENCESLWTRGYFVGDHAIPFPTFDPDALRAAHGHFCKAGYYGPLSPPYPAYPLPPPPDESALAICANHETLRQLKRMGVVFSWCSFMSRMTMLIANSNEVDTRFSECRATSGMVTAFYGVKFSPLPYQSHPPLAEEATRPLAANYETLWQLKRMGIMFSYDPISRRMTMIVAKSDEVDTRFSECLVTGGVITSFCGLKRKRE